MHVLMEIPGGFQNISNLLLGENFRKFNFRKFSGNLLPVLNFRKIYNPKHTSLKRDVSKSHNEST